MNYLKVRWLHQLDDEPIVLLSEVDENRYEVRKIEVLSDGRVGYASEGLQLGDTMLGELPLPAADKIAADAQFVVEELTQAEFEIAWKSATA